MTQTQDSHSISSECALNTTQLAIYAEGLTFGYPDSLDSVISIPDWQVKVGERVFLEGASGTGKSTLLQLLCGLQIGTGKLCVAGTDLSELSVAKRDRFRARTIGMVFQNFNLIPYLSSLDNIVLAASLSGQNVSVSTESARKLLNEIGLDAKFWQQRASTLSIGQQQRVAIARAFINSPEILLFDEPTSALDEVNRNLFMEVLIRYLDEHSKTTVIFVSHDTRLASYFEKSITLSGLSKPVESAGEE